MAGLLDWIGERLDSPLKGVGIDPASIPDSEKWAYRGRVVDAFGRSLGAGGQSFGASLDDMAVKRQEYLDAERERQLQQQLQAQLAQAGSGGGTNAEVYRRYAQVLAMANKPDLAKKYLDMADALQPREEYSTDPKTMMVGDQPVSVLFSKTGGMKIIDLKPLPNRKYQDTGSEILVIDDTSGRVLSRLPKSLSPAEAGNLRIAAGNLAVAQGNLGLSQQRFNREGVETGVGPNGEIVTYNKFNPGAGSTAVPGVRPTSAAGAEKPTEGQLGAAGYLLRMRRASELLDGPATDAQGQPMVDGQGRPVPLEQVGAGGYGQSIVRSVPFVGDSAANTLSSRNSQLYRQAQEDWVRAKLRKESGAVIGDEEMAREIKTYFPQPGDSQAVRAQKARARVIAEQAMEIASGSAAGRVPAAGAAPAPAGGTSPRIGGPRPSLDNIFGGKP